MSDEDQGRKRRRGLPILLGIVGAVLGYAGTLLLFEFIGFGERGDIGSAVIVALVFCPMGAVAGILGGVKLGRAMTGGAAAAPGAGAAAEPDPGFARTSFKTIGIVVAAVVVIGGGYAFYAYQTATPWMRPANVRIEFEVRLPSGAPMPTGEVKAELQTSVNTMPVDMKPERYRQEGDQAVIAGEVWLHYRAIQRQIEVKVPGRPDRTYPLKLKSSPPHTPFLGAWERHPDGSEIRYRVRYPGES